MTVTGSVVLAAAGLHALHVVLQVASSEGIPGLAEFTKSLLPSGGSVRRGRSVFIAVVVAFHWFFRSDGSYQKI